MRGWLAMASFTARIGVQPGFRLGVALGMLPSIPWPLSSPKQGAKAGSGAFRVN